METDSDVRINRGGYDSALVTQQAEMKCLYARAHGTTMISDA